MSHWPRTSIRPKQESSTSKTQVVGGGRIQKISLTGRYSERFFGLQKLYILNSEQIIDDYSIEYHPTAESLDLKLLKLLLLMCKTTSN